MSDIDKQKKQHVVSNVIFSNIHVSVQGIEWKLDLLGTIKPIVMISPIDIGGVVISNVSGKNVRYINDNNIGFGAGLSIARTGKNAARIVSVLKGTQADIPTQCPRCGSPVFWRGMNIRCLNSDCEEVQVKRVAKFLRNCGIKKMTDVLLRNWGIISFSDLVAWSPVEDSQPQFMFYNDLTDKVFSKDEFELFSNLVFDGATKATIEKILNHYTLRNKRNITYATTKAMIYYPQDFPEGITQTILQNMKSDWFDNTDVIKILVADQRYNPVESAP